MSDKVEKLNQDRWVTEIEICPEPDCVLAAGHPKDKHASRRVSMLACPHNVPNFGPECPICDVASIQLAGKLNYELYGNPNGRRR